MFGKNASQLSSCIGWSLLIPDRVRSKKPAVHKMMFSTQTIDIESELENAYTRATYKGMSVPHLIDSALRSVLTVAMTEIFMKAKESKDPHAKYMEGGPKEFAKAARPRRTPKGKLRKGRAIRMARLYEEVRPIAADILKFVVDYDKTHNHDSLETQLEQTFPKTWIRYITRGEALRHLPEIPGHEEQQTLSKLDCTPRQLAVGVVWCVEDARREGPRLKPITILEHYIPLGKKLLGTSRTGKRL